jgi:glycosyltransferase involved in cell wall biosynthesis
MPVAGNNTGHSPENADRVAIFLASLEGGGSERIALNLAQGFAERGLEVDLVLQRAEGPYLAQVPDEIRIVDLRAGRMARAAFPLITYLRRERPPFLLSLMMGANIIAILSRKLARVDTRLVISEHLNISIASGNAVRLRSRYLPLMAKRTYPWADGIVAVSEGVAEDLARTLGLPRKKIEVIYNPVITPELLEKAREPVDHPWFQPGEPPVILGAGRLTGQKDFPTLLRAFSLVRKERPVRLVILGEGEDRHELKALVDELGLAEDVEMPGFVDNPYGYMAGAAVFVQSSRWEGLPTVLIEAMALGKPVVATDCPSGAREILNDGRYGTLVPVGDVKRLAAGISAMLEQPVEPLPAWVDRFRPDCTIQAYLKALGCLS